MKCLIPFVILLLGCKEPKNDQVYNDLKGQKEAVIILDEYELTDIPTSISQLSTLESLTILKSKQSGDWTVLPPLSWFENRKHKPPFTKLPAEIATLQNLKELKLFNLGIKELPSELKNLRHLEELDLSLNKLNIDKELKTLKSIPSLKKLYIYGNHFDVALLKRWKSEQPEIEIYYQMDN